MKTLRVLLWDHLSPSISSLDGLNSSQDIILMCELFGDATYVKHHKKKLAFIFSAMRHFAEELKATGHNVIYKKLDDVDNSGTFKDEIKKILSTYSIDEVVVTHPGAYHILQDIHEWKNSFQVPVEIREDNRFLCSLKEFDAWIENKKSPRMEYFYREMRKKYNILMDGANPVGGQWNYDTQNRKTPKEGLSIPPSYVAKKDTITSDVMALVHEKFSDHFGDLEPFYFAVNRSQALEALDLFIQERLNDFGSYQDAMVEGEPWMYHSHLSFYLNCGLLLPLECVTAAEKAYQEGRVPLNSVEGFIRQIIGWREYVRGIYWSKMPTYATENFFEAKRDLPSLYWTSKTKMNCLHQCVSETKRNAYAHHIQRLMVLGNFALIAGIDPAQVNEWFLIVYADAYDWVELPNVSGMTLFADGGFLASKPYASGGSYINKMSNYCKNCHYKVQQKSGEDACPFNYLYWDFLARNMCKLKSNHRMGIIYKAYEKMSEEKKKIIQTDSEKFLSRLK